MTKKYKLLQSWLGGQYVVMKGTEVFFERNITSYMVFHEGKIKVSNAIFEFDGTPTKEYFEEIKEEQPFLWSDALIKEYGEWYRSVQGKLKEYPELFGKDLFDFFKSMNH